MQRDRPGSSLERAEREQSPATDCSGASIGQLGLVKSVSQPGLATVTTVSDAAGRPAKVTDGAGSTCSVYDGLGRLTSMQAPDRASGTTYGYDRDGRRTSVADPTMPGTALYTYDDLGRLATAKDVYWTASEAVPTYTYDENGNVTQRVDKTGTTTYTLDEADRITQITDPALRIYTFAYDADGKLTTQNYPTGSNLKALLAYDNANRLTSYKNQTTTGSAVAEYVYTLNARSEKLTEDGPQGFWKYTYDHLGRLEQAHDPNTGRTRRYAFDLDSNRSEVRLNAGWSVSKATESWGADPLLPGNMSLVANANPAWIGDNASFARALKFAFPFAGTTYPVGTTLYVSTNGFVTISTSAGAAQAPDLYSTTFKLVSPLGRDLTIPDPAAPANLGKGYGIFVEEPSDNSLVRIRWRGVVTGTTTDARFEAVLYPSGVVRFRYETLPATGTAQVGLTPGNGIDFAEAPGYHRAVVPSNAQAAIFTGASETVSSSYGYNALDQLTSGTGMSGIVWSTDGEQTSVTGPSPRGAYTFTYDGRHLMTGATTAGVTTSWTIDGDGRVVKRTKTGVSGETRFRFAGPGDTPGWEENASAAITTAFVSGPGGLLASYAGPPASSAATYYLLNGHGDVAQTRNSTGGPLESYVYDEYGNPTSSQAPSRYGYVGRWQKERDPDSSLVRMGVRMYDPLVGRFTSWDPVEGGSLNAYDYAGQDPVNGYDLDGRAACAECNGGGSSHSDVVWCDVCGGLDMLGAGAAGVFGGRLRWGVRRPIAKGRITGYRRHGIHSAISHDGHGLSPSGILDAVRNPLRIVRGVDHKGRPFIKYVGRFGVVITNRRGQVVTVRASTRGGYRE